MRMFKGGQKPTWCAPAGVRRNLLVAAAATALPLPIFFTPAGTAYGSPEIDVDAVCQAQYPASGMSDAGHAYLMDPGDAYSWRCKQGSLPGGAMVGNLPVDVAAYCAQFGKRATPAASPNWACT
jgi:hypothetical protein